MLGRKRQVTSKLGPATSSAGRGSRPGTAVANKGDDHFPLKLLVPSFIVLVMVGSALGLYAKDWRQALNVVSRVLLVCAVLLGIGALVQHLRERRAVSGAVGRHRTAVVVAVPDELVTEGAAVGFTTDEAEVGPVEIDPVEDRPVPVAAGAVATAARTSDPATDPEVAPREPRPEVLDAIAPYAEVVGQPVFYEDHPVLPAAPVAPAASALATAARPSIIPPPPPAARPAVPPPPPPGAPAPVVSPPPGAPAPVVSAPVVSAPVVSAPVVSAPVVSAPVISAPVVSTPVISAPVVAPVVPDARPVDVPRAVEPVVALPADAVPDAAAVDESIAEGHTVMQTDLVVPDPRDSGLPSADVPGWSRSSAFPAARGTPMPFASGTAELTARSAVGSVAPVIVYRYRKWVLGQMVPGAPFEPVAVDRTPDEWLLLSTCGVATLMAWTHEDHHFTYPVETWADEILPAHGVRIRDRQLAVDLLLAAALHAGGIDAVPSDRLRSYQPGDLVTAMASIHVGLLRLYCGLGRIGPERVLADQYGIGPGDIPLH